MQGGLLPSHLAMAKQEMGVRQFGDVFWLRKTTLNVARFSGLRDLTLSVWCAIAPAAFPASLQRLTLWGEGYHGLREDMCVPSVLKMETQLFHASTDAWWYPIRSGSWPTSPSAASMLRTGLRLSIKAANSFEWLYCACNSANDWLS